MRRRIFLILIVCVVLILSTTPVFAGTILVISPLDDGAGCTLRDAINEANTVGAGGATLSNGCFGASAGANTITVPAGTYNINSQLPTVTTTISIQAPFGSAVTIQASATPNTANYRIFNVTSAAGILSLTRLTIQNGGVLGAINGGCINVDTSATLSLLSAVVNNCRGEFGGGIHANDQAIVFATASSIQNNQADRSGAGLFVQEAGIIFNDVVIQDNTTVNLSNNGTGGGIAALSPTSFLVSSSTFSNNQVGSSLGGSGGALYITFATGSSIDESVFINNRATGSGTNNGGAVYTAGGSTLSISNSRFQSNMADAQGSAVYSAATGVTTITDSCFTNNNATAVADSILSGTITASGGGNIADANWWGSSWGPRILLLTLNTASFNSSGDSINGNGATVFNSQLVDVGLTSAGDGGSAPTGAWLATAPTVAGALCETKASPFTGAGFRVNVSFQARPAAPHTRLIVPLTVILKPVGGGAALINTTLSTDQNAILRPDFVTPGNYWLWVKGAHTLSVLQNVTLAAGTNTVTLNTALREGDADNNNQIVLPDFSLLATAFGSSTGDPNYNAQTDFNGDGQVVLIDFSLLASNFGEIGSPVP